MCTVASWVQGALTAAVGGTGSFGGSRLFVFTAIAIFFLILFTCLYFIIVICCKVCARRRAMRHRWPHIDGDDHSEGAEDRSQRPWRRQQRHGPHDGEGDGFNSVELADLQRGRDEHGNKVVVVQMPDDSVHIGASCGGATKPADAVPGATPDDEHKSGQENGTLHDALVSRALREARHGSIDSRVASERAAWPTNVQAEAASAAMPASGAHGADASAADNPDADALHGTLPAQDASDTALQDGAVAEGDAVSSPRLQGLAESTVAGQRHV